MNSLSPAVLSAIQTALAANEARRAAVMASVAEQLREIAIEGEELWAAINAGTAPSSPFPDLFPDERHLYKGGNLLTISARGGAPGRQRDRQWRAGTESDPVVEYWYGHGSNTRALRDAGVGTMTAGGGFYSVAELAKYCRSHTTPKD